MTRCWLLAAATALALIAVGHAGAELPPLIPRDILFGNPERLNPQISPDGKYLAYLAPDEHNVLQVWVRTVGQQDDKQLTAAKKRGIPFYGWPYDGEHIGYAQDTDGDENWHQYIVNLKSGIVRDLTPFQGIQARFMAAEPHFPDQWLVALNLKDRRTHDVYRIDLKTGAVELDTENPGNVVRWTADRQFKVRAATATTPDGGFDLGSLTTPVGIPAQAVPTVLLVHGGPWARDTWGYSSAVQWLANRGYAVLQVNFRGSTGYGKPFLNAGNREWAGNMHDDLIDGVNWMVQHGIADPKKVAIMGGSYGGYATLVGLTFTPAVFAAGVDLVGISNLVTWFKSIPPYWAPLRAVWARRVGDPDKEEEFLKSRSPLFFVDRIKAPLLIGQGANDVRVAQAESDQIVAALRQVNKPVEYVVYTDEGHGLARPENRLHFFAKAEAFLATYLGGRFEPLEEVKGHAGVLR